MNRFFVGTIDGKPTIIDQYNPHLRYHPRPSYTFSEACETALWLKERENGYPVPESLKHLRVDR